MDYLRILPVETWLDILFEAASFMNIPPDPYTHLSLLREEQYPYRKAKQLQSKRLELLLVCKSFHRMAEPLLYSEIVFSGENQFAKFQAVATTKIFYGHPCANLTKSLFIYSKVLPVLKDPHFPHNTFPNLVAFVAYGVGARICSYWSEGIIGEKSPSLTHTTFNYVGDDDNCCDGYSWIATVRLEKASISATLNSIQNGPHSPLNALRSLNIRQYEFKSSDILRLELLSLRSLYLELSGDDSTSPATRQFLEKHGTKLVELELSTNASYSSSSLSFPDGLFEMCPALETLSFGARSVQPMVPQMWETVVPYFALSNLIIGGYTWDIEDHSIWFNRNRFPNLSLITFVFDYYDAVAARDSFRTSALTLFPGIDLAFEE